MTPEQIAKSGSEYAEQCALFAWIAFNKNKYPELDLLFAIKNEEKSGSKVVGGRFKATGVKKGVADLLLPVSRYVNYDPCCGLFIEMKKKGGKLSKEQIEFGEKVKLEGYLWVCCYGWKEARDILIKYLEG